MLAAGGDPHRDFDAHGRAVASLAADLDEPERRGELVAALDELNGRAAGLSVVQQALDGLRADEDAAWRWFAAALLADELSTE